MQQLYYNACFISNLFGHDFQETLIKKRGQISYKGLNESAARVNQDKKKPRLNGA